VGRRRAALPRPGMRELPGHGLPGPPATTAAVSSADRDMIYRRIDERCAREAKKEG
jgi:hypothetical protein